MEVAFGWVYSDLMMPLSQIKHSAIFYGLTEVNIILKRKVFMHGVCDRKRQDAPALSLEAIVKQEYNQGVVIKQLMHYVNNVSA